MKLSVSMNHRHLVDEHGAPFLWLGDTAWELFHKLDREDTVHYLDTRRAQGFTVIQAVLLAELDGVRTANRYGRVPLLRNAEGEFDPTLPDLGGDYSYWDHVNFVLDEAERRGLVLALLPTWGDKYNRQENGAGPEFFGRENAFLYGRWLGERYAHRDGIVWVLGGDRHLVCARHFDVNRALAEGLKAGGATQMITFHPRGDSSSSQCVGEEPWLDFNMIQSGHGEFVTPSWAMIAKDYALLPTKPVVEGEPKYEDHPPSFNAANGYFDGFDTRKAAYWAMFSGALGVTYGHSCVWCMIGEDERTDYHFLTWRESLRRPGAENYVIMGAFLRDQGFPAREPAQDALAHVGEGDQHIAASRRGRELAVYSPYGLPVKLTPEALGQAHSARFFDPRTGAYHAATLSGAITCPSCGRGNDWVLLVE